MKMQGFIFWEASKPMVFVSRPKIKPAKPQHCRFAFSGEGSRDHKIILWRSLKNEKLAKGGLFYVHEIRACSGIEMKIKKASNFKI